MSSDPAPVPPASDTTRAPLHWLLLCRVVDNLGDAAVMWRLARQLAVEHGREVSLHVDQPAVLKRLVPQALPGGVVEGVEGMPWATSRCRAPLAPLPGRPVSMPRW